MSLSGVSTNRNKGQPDNMDDTQGCVNALIARDRGSIEDSSCSKSLGYICEVFDLFSQYEKQNNIMQLSVLFNNLHCSDFRVHYSLRAQESHALTTIALKT
jgi:hypothetical protein